MTGDPDRAGVTQRSAVLVTYRLATPSSTSTAQAMMASKMRSMGLHADSQACERPRLLRMWAGVPLAARGHYMRRNQTYVKMIGMVPKVRRIAQRCASLG
jgi:hypothetical protein